MKDQKGFIVATALALVTSVAFAGASPAIGVPVTASSAQTVASGWSPVIGSTSLGSAGAHGALSSTAGTVLQTIPVWSSSFEYQGTTFPYTMVGTSPTQARTTLIPTVLVPIDLTFENAGPNVSRHVNGSARIPALLKSPIFQFATYPATGDTTQFADAVSRAEWSSVVTNRNQYHTLLVPVDILPAVRLTVPSALGQVVNPGDGIPRATVDGSWWEQVIPGLVASLRIPPEVLPIFVTSDTGAGLEAGFHGAFEGQGTANRSAIWTYVWASWFDPGWFSIFNQPPAVGADSDVLSHETTEWVNDPFLDNVVPPWSFSVPPIIFDACSNLLETGDPLEETPFAVSLHGVTYHLQDEALFSYFARQSPSIGFLGRYSFLGTLTTFSSPCSSG